VSAIHQFVPMLHHGDAVGRHTFRLREVLVARGIDSRIYVELTDPETAGETQPYLVYEQQAAAGDILLYQFATASGIATWLTNRPETLVVNYHNVTPAELYAPWNNLMARHQVRARAQLRQLAPRASLGIAVSAFNEAELKEAGYARTAVVPPAALLPSTTTPPAAATQSDPAMTASRAGARWLMIGRMAPNKAIELGIMALLVARSHHDPGATLEVVGPSVVPDYTAALRRYSEELGLRGAVTFRGAVTDAEVAASMARSDVLVLSSLHEGFGVPILEAMGAGLPVVANRTGALPEVVGEAGLLVDATNPYELAGAVAAVLSDRSQRERLVQAGARQVASLDLGTAGDRAVDLVASLQS
jgi:glycosyltransferase involved in cell wall biosynthesis